MATTNTPEAKTLEALGARRLAELLMEISSGDALVANLLQLEFAGTKGPAKASLEIREQMARIRRSRVFFEWDESPALARELDILRGAIVNHVADSDASEALGLMWGFMELADAVFDRCDDSGGSVGDVFLVAREDLGEIASAAKTAPALLADQAFAAIMNNNYAQYDGLVGILKPALGCEGLECLKQRLIESLSTTATQPTGKVSTSVGLRSLGSVSEDERRERYRRDVASSALRDIADAQDDVDGYIAQYDEETRRVPPIAAQIARRLLAAGRAGDALHALDASSRSVSSDRRWIGFEWEDARVAALEALGRTDAAQQVRWDCFERSLSMLHLRAYLERLAKSSAADAEEKALDHVQDFQDRLAALSFFLSWPALERASRLVVEHAKSLDGNCYEILAPAARALASQHPLAATLTFRAMIDFTLGRGKSTRYRHAARHLSQCASLAADIGDFQGYEAHGDYEQRLRREHGRKRSFWGRID